MGGWGRVGRRGGRRENGGSAMVVGGIDAPAHSVDWEKSWFLQLTYCDAACCFTADDVGQRLREEAMPVFHQHSTATTVTQNNDVTNSGFTAGNSAQSALDRHWRHQQLIHLRSELPAVDSRIAHLRVLMDLARSVR